MQIMHVEVEVSVWTKPRRIMPCLIIIKWHRRQLGSSGGKGRGPAGALMARPFDHAPNDPPQC